MTSTKISLSANAQKIKSILEEKNINFELFEFNDETRTALDAANVIGCEVSQIMKSIVFRATESNRGILVLASGSNRINEKIIASEIGEKLVKADADFIREITGYAIGGVPPMGHKHPMITFVDEDLFHYTDVWAAAGTPRSVFKLASKKIPLLINGKTLRVKK